MNCPQRWPATAGGCPDEPEGYAFPRGGHRCHLDHGSDHEHCCSCGSRPPIKWGDFSYRIAAAEVEP